MRGILSLFLLISGVLGLGYVMGFEILQGDVSNGQVMFLDEGLAQDASPHSAVIDLSNDGELAEVTLSVAEIEQEIAPGVKQLFWVFYRPGDQPQYPSPTIVVKEGQRVRINFDNDTHYLHHTIHLHGVNKPWQIDGVPEIEQDAVAPGGSFVYEFVAENPGTHWYHCHVQADTHIEMGLMGAFIILPENRVAYESFSYNEYGVEVNSIGNYDREYVLILDDIDQELHHRVYEQITFPLMAAGDHAEHDADEKPEDMPMDHDEHAASGEDSEHEPDEHNDQTEMDNQMEHDQKADVERVLGPHLVMQHMIEVAGVKQLDEAFNHIHHMAMMQFVDPYDSTQRKPRYFTVNGMGFPYALLNSPIVVKSGEVIKLRLINSSFAPISFHLHGHEALVTHYDGYKDPYPVVRDTILIPAAGRVDLLIKADKDPGVWVLHDHSAQRVTNGGQYPGGMITALIYEDMDVTQVPNKLMCRITASILQQDASQCDGKSELSIGPLVGLDIEDFPRLRPMHQLK